MTTCNDIVTRALRRIRVVAVFETPSAEDAAVGLQQLNGMMFQWPALGVDPKWETAELSDTFTFFVPPADATAEVIDALASQGNWDANANSPALATGTGTLGYYYKVTTAGSTTLDDVTSWAVGDYAVFNGTEWLKSVDPVRFEQAVVELLALELSQTYGRDVGPVLASAARTGWMQIQAAYIKAPNARVDSTLMHSMIAPYGLADPV